MPASFHKSVNRRAARASARRLHVGAAVMVVEGAALQQLMLETFVEVSAP